MYIIEVTQEKLTMKTMTVRGSPIFRNLLVAAAVVILVFGLKYSSEVLAPIFWAATLAILFTPALWWLEKKGLPAWLALLVMVLALGGFIILIIIILTASLEQLALRLPVYAELLQDRRDEKNVVEEQSDTPDRSNATLRVDSADASMDQE